MGILILNITSTHFVRKTDSPFLNATRNTHYRVFEFDYDLLLHKITPPIPRRLSFTIFHTVSQLQDSLVHTLDICILTLYYFPPRYCFNSESY